MTWPFDRAHSEIRKDPHDSRQPSILSVGIECTVNVKGSEKRGRRAADAVG